MTREKEDDAKAEKDRSHTAFLVSLIRADELELAELGLGLLSG